MFQVWWRLAGIGWTRQCFKIVYILSFCFSLALFQFSVFSALHQIRFNKYNGINQTFRAKWTDLHLTIMAWCIIDSSRGSAVLGDLSWRSLLKTDIFWERRQWTGGERVRWLTGWQNHPIPSIVPQSRVQLHPRLTLGRTRPTLRQMNFGRFVGLGYHITTQILPARSGLQWRVEMNCRYQN